MEEPVFETDQIQGNIIPGFRLPHQQFFACQTNELSSLKDLFEYIVPRLTDMKEALAFKEDRLLTARHLKRLPKDAFGFTLTKGFFWINIGFDASFMNRFTQEVSAIDSSFRLGMAARSSLLGDPSDPNAEGNKKNWKFGNEEKRADIMIVTGSDSADVLYSHCAELRALLSAWKLTIVFEQRADRLDNDEEHFGFKDGISQPAIRGYTDPHQTLLYPREIVSGNDQPGSMEFSTPGKLLIWPGQFVFGFPKQSSNHFREPQMPSAAETGEFLRNGSFMVVRRLRQDVGKFINETQTLHSELTQEKGFEHTDYDTFLSKLVGRYKDGRPAIFGENDHPEFNNFNYKAATPEFDLQDGRHLQSVPADPPGLRCPMFSHIRKVNPRDLSTDQGAEMNTATTRILRRGIPFGPRFNTNNQGDENNKMERGLFFICYQTSIENQFELLVSKWMNEDSRPETRVGFDMLVGQNNEEDAGGIKWCTFLNGSGQSKVLTSAETFIIPTGGGYYFCPSVLAMKKIQSLLTT